MTRLFASAFELASQNLSPSDVALLSRTSSGRWLDLDWLRDDVIQALRARLLALASRPLKYRYRLRKPEREELIRILGGIEAFSDPRRMFVLAGLIDEVNHQIRTDWAQVAAEQWAQDRIALKAHAFFDGISNAPPPIGQMATVQVCRRWMQNLMVIGDLRRVEGLGPFPVPTIRSAIGRDHSRLSNAVDEGVLRFGLVAWRRHTKIDLALEEIPPGCFRVSGLKVASQSGSLEQAMETLTREAIHVAVFPELALDDSEFEQLRAWLRNQKAAFPVLTVVGRTHQIEDGRVANVALLLNSRGEILIQHRKREPYTLPQEGPPERSLLEGIDPPPATFEAFDSPVGRLAINICRDVRSDVPMLLNRILGTSLLICPAYSPKLDFALEEARLLGQRQTAITVAVNPFNREVTQDGAALYGPVRGPRGQPVRWPSKHAEAPILLWECRIAADKVGAVTAPTWSNC